MDFIYADAASTTPVSDAVINEMIPYFNENFGNPSSVHTLGVIAKEAIDKSRQKIANILGCNSDELIFTSGATESNNTALAMGKKHIITSAIEHHAILNTLKNKDVKVTYLPVYSNGIVRPIDLINAITPETDLVSIMTVNNEIGTINPIEEIGRICKQKGILFHTDATQYIGHTNKKLPLGVIDMFSFSGHKFGAPKGIGGLYVKNGININPFIYGGQQEKGLRAGTENVPYIVGMAKALELSDVFDARQIKELREELLLIPGARLNGDPVNRCSNIINISFDGVRGEMLAYFLNQYGIAVSTGSACTSESDEPSHVLKAIGLSDDMANSSIRFSFTKDITKNQIEYIIKTVTNAVNLMRSDS